MLAAASSAEADPCDVRLTRDPVPVRIDYDPFAFSRPPGVWIWTWSTMAMGGAIWSCGF